MTGKIPLNNIFYDMKRFSWIIYVLIFILLYILFYKYTIIRNFPVWQNQKLVFRSTYRYSEPGEKSGPHSFTYGSVSVMNYIFLPADWIYYGISDSMTKSLNKNGTSVQSKNEVFKQNAILLLTNVDNSEFTFKLKRIEYWTNSINMIFVPVPKTKVWLSIWETRVMDYSNFAQISINLDKSWRNPGFKQDGRHPVIYITWREAKEFCDYLTEKERNEGLIHNRQSYRLPTDIEWSAAIGLPIESGITPKERDCKIKDIYLWGTGWPPPKGIDNYHESFNCENYEYTSPVGTFKPNRYGLFDLGGNVSEFCEDWYDNRPKYRVARGASWTDNANTLHRKESFLASYRKVMVETHRSPAFGFRVAFVMNNE